MRVRRLGAPSTPRAWHRAHVPLRSMHAGRASLRPCAHVVQLFDCVDTVYRRPVSEPLAVLVSLIFCVQSPVLGDPDGSVYGALLTSLFYRADAHRCIDSLVHQSDAAAPRVQRLYRFRMSLHAHGQPRQINAGQSHAGLCAHVVSPSFCVDTTYRRPARELRTSRCIWEFSLLREVSPMRRLPV